MANASDYLILSTQQLVTNYKLRSRAINSETISAQNASTNQILTVNIDYVPAYVTVTPTSVRLYPQQTSVFGITYDTAYLETLPTGNTISELNFSVSATPVDIPAPPLPPPPPPPPPPSPSPVVTVTILPNSNTFNIPNQSRQFVASLVVNGVITPATFTWKLYDDNGFSINSTTGYITANATGQYSTTVVATVDTPVEFRGMTASATAVANIRSEIEYTPIYGCTNPAAFNYNGNATVDDGSCIEKTIGCLDPNAINYDPNATVSGRCEYAAPIAGCMDPGSSNYNPDATISDGSCIQRDISRGCTDPSAINYSITAAEDDGSCIPMVYGCADPAATNYNPNANTSAECVYNVYGCMDPSAMNYDPAATISRDCSYPVYGCMDSDAWNYNPFATSNDGVECKYTVYGCMDPAAINYNAFATNSEGVVCSYPNITVTQGDGGISTSTGSGGGSLDQTTLSGNDRIGDGSSIDMERADRINAT